MSSPSPPARDPRFWPYAAAFGALWGVFEVTVGTFINTLRLPLAAVILAATGVAILVAQRQLLSRPGLTLATGLVAALCKATSPGGVILNPMIGILVEALVVELVLLPRPRSALAAGLAGLLAAHEPWLHKLSVQVLFYGTTVLELYVALGRRIGGALGLERQHATLIAGVVLAAISLLGAGAGLLGWYVGRAAARRLRAPEQERAPAGPAVLAAGVEVQRV